MSPFKPHQQVSAFNLRARLDQHLGNLSTPLRVQRRFHLHRFESQHLLTLGYLGPGFNAGAPFSGKADATAKFAEPGDYVLHVTGNDYSGDGGGGFGCCWTTSLVKVSVK